MNFFNCEKNFKLNFIIIGATILFSLFVNQGTSLGKDFNERVQLDERSWQAGIGRQSIELLKRMEGPGKDKMIQQIIERFESNKVGITTQGEWELKQEKTKSTSVVGKGWRLRVWGDGTRFSYTNQTVMETAQKHAIPIDQRFSNETLERIGRQFIDTALKGWVTLSNDEELIPLYTEFEISGGISSDGTPDQETVLASAIHFGRSIDEINVVGSGSRISIYVDNQGQPFDFDIDWPLYEKTGKSQEVLSIESILDRLDNFDKMRQEADEIDIVRLECGYFDSGVWSNSSDNYIQAGCRSFIVETYYNPASNSEMRSPIIRDILAGVEDETL